MLHRPLQLPTRLALFRLATALCATALPLAAALASTPLALGARALSLDVAGWDRASMAGFEGGHRVLQEAQEELWRRQEAGSGGTSGLEMGRQEFVLKLVFSVAFVLLGGVFSGLSLGLMGLDSMNLQVLAVSGPPRDRADAQKVLSLLSHGRHFVLVCLLLSNVIVNETLPVFLDSLTGGGGVLAVVISSAAIVIFGEVLPQALCARHGLRIGAACTGFVKVLMYLEAPICWPTAKLLDLLLGAHTTHLYRREELRTLVELHDGELGKADAALVGVLLEEPKTVSGAMRKIDEVYCASEGARLCDVDLKQLLVRRQHFLPVRRAPSAIHPVPVGVEQPFVGFVPVEQLCAALSQPNELVRSLAPQPLVQVLPTTSLSDCVSFLKREDPSAVLLISHVRRRRSFSAPNVVEQSTMPFCARSQRCTVRARKGSRCSTTSLGQHFSRTSARAGIGPSRSARRRACRCLDHRAHPSLSGSGASCKASSTGRSCTAHRRRSSRSASRPTTTRPRPPEGTGPCLRPRHTRTTAPHPSPPRPPLHLPLRRPLRQPERDSPGSAAASRSRRPRPVSPGERPRRSCRSSSRRCSSWDRRRTRRARAAEEGGQRGTRSCARRRSDGVERPSALYYSLDSP